MRIPWTYVLEQLREIKIYMLWYTEQYSPWIFSSGNGNDNYPPTSLGNVLCVQKCEWNKKREVKKRQARFFIFEKLKKSCEKSFFSTFKNLYRFFISSYNTDISPLCIVPLWRNSREKSHRRLRVAFRVLQTVREQIFGNLNEDVPKVLSAALVPHASVKFIGCTRRFRH